jgi:hypothetical protein
MTSDQRIESERKLLRLRLALAVAIVALLGWIGYSLFESNLRAATSEANAQTLARDIGTVCAEQGKLMINNRDLCAKGETVLANPTDVLPGPKGDKGNDGKPGKDSTIPGPMGPMGPAGKDSTVPGPPGRPGIDGDDGLAGLTVQGPPGSDGAPSNIPGPQGEPGLPGRDGVDGAPGKDGADSTVPGPAGPEGPAGPVGKDGRGVQSAFCGDDGRWTITYTDGTTSDGGQCRTDPAPPIGVTP